MINKELQIIPT